ncbi:unnamed protein product [Penicillium egyptiacum]|uniref:Uncharacterized protein n=1 Tax=Penicillium egyptiacum TaxID=1303716 RepID=A0A9W4KJH2_9EURO|nr:unnamed protein product [Penicillium egyptiacum]
MIFRTPHNPEWMGMSGADIKYLILAHFCYAPQQIDNVKLGRLTGISAKYARRAFATAKRNVLRLGALDAQFMSIVSEEAYVCTQGISDDQTEKSSKYKKSKFSPDESDEGSTAESSESETDDFRSKGLRQNAKRKNHANRKRKGKSMTIDSESADEDSEVGDDESPLPNFKTPSKTQRQKTKQKAPKHKGHAKHSASHGARKGRDSPFHTSTKSSSSRAGRQNIQRKQGLKRGRDPHHYQDGSTEESADESSSAEMYGSSRTSYGRIKRKRLGKPSGLADTSDDDSEMEEEVGRRSARAYAKYTPVKTKSQAGNRKKLGKTNELAESPDKDLVGGAMDGLSLNWDASKTNGRAAKSTKHDGEGDSV